MIKNIYTVVSSSQHIHFQKIHFSEFKSLQLCPTFCEAMDCSPPDSSVHWILQARILEWVLFAPQGDLPDPGIEPRFSVSSALAGEFLPLSQMGSPSYITYEKQKEEIKAYLLLRVSTLQKNIYAINLKHIFSIKYLLIRIQTTVFSWEETEYMHLI